MTPAPIPEPDLHARLAGELPGWRVADGALQRDYRTGDWSGTLLLANAIGFAAEAAGHHPELRLRYDALTVRLRTHDADGITELDLALAARVETLAGWRAEP